jgi:RHS repeat-associated protein
MTAEAMINDHHELNNKTLKNDSRNLCESVTIRENPCYGETVYINQFMEVKDDDLATKSIYVGESRIVSKLTHIHDLNGGEYERINTYYHHHDHLGTSNVITDYQGAIYKEIYLTAWGEEFVNRGDTLKKITADFTGKPYDSETKMHYFGARYYDSKTSRWVSPDPAYSEYLNSDKGMGGIYNPVNSQVYHYAGNNPLKYVDPDGRVILLRDLDSDDINQAPRRSTTTTSTSTTTTTTTIVTSVNRTRNTQNTTRTSTTTTTTIQNNVNRLRERHRLRRVRTAEFYPIRK